jgi:predicted dehydrogenase
MKSIGIGLLGYGAIGKIHTLGYKDLPLLYPGRLPEIRLAGVCTRSPESARVAAQQGGFASWHTEASTLIQDDAVNVIDCSLPNYLHREMLLQSFAAGKHVYCEKPLALDGAQARELLLKARQAGVYVGVTFNFRFIPALMRAKELIAQGALGGIYSFHAEYLHTGYQNPERPMSWRLRKEKSGGGALVDLGSHVIDLVRHLMGEFEAVRTLLQTFIRERPVAKGSRQKEPVTVEDAAWLEARLRSGAIGTIEVTRFATGALDDLNIEIYGEMGALKFNLMDANWLYWFDANRSIGTIGNEHGWMRLETVQNYPGAAIPPPRSFLGWTRSHAENQFQFLRSVAEGSRVEPDIIDGLRTQLIMEAAYRSAETGGWAAVEQE